MKRVIWLMMAFSLTLSFSSYGQETREERRAVAKEKQAALDSLSAQQIKTALAEKKWVLEADRLSNTIGETINVNSNLNFIALEGKEAYVQLGSESGMGSNGVGGVTIRANVEKYDVTKSKRGTYYIHVFLTSVLGNFDISIDMNNTGQMASATIQGNTANSITYSGRVIPLNHSTIYKGTPLF